LLFFSGLSALVYRTIWSKQLALVVGVDNAYYDWFFGRVRGGR